MLNNSHNKIAGVNSIIHSSIQPKKKGNTAYFYHVIIQETEGDSSENVIRNSWNWPRILGKFWYNLVNFEFESNQKDDNSEAHDLIEH